jgi:biopolymer transport protein ExbD
MAKVRMDVPDAGGVGFNMTPMIDCTFQLIIFFILASQVANDAYASNVIVPRPYASQSVPIRVVNIAYKVTVNVVSMDPRQESEDKLAAATAAFYKIAQEKFNPGEWERMGEVIKNLKTRAEKEGHVVAGDPSKEFYMEIRADKKINWQDVSPVIRAGVEAGIRKMNMTALTQQGGVEEK